MAKWVDSIDQTTALLTAWNGAGPNRVSATHVLADNTNTATLCYLVLKQPLSDAQRILFKDLLTSDALDDSTRLTLLGQLRTILVDVEVAGGITAPSGLVDLPDKQWRFVMDAKLRCDDLPLSG